MNAFKHTIVAGLLLSALIGCGSAADSAAEFVESGKSLLEQGKVSKAKLEFKNAIQVDPKMAEPFYQLALIDEKDKRWKSMFTNLTKVEQLDPGHHDAIIKLGQVYLLAGNFELALEKVNKIITADKLNVMAWVLRGSISMKQKDFDAALKDVEQALSLDNENIEALSVKALTQNLQGDSEQALRTLDKAIALKPNQLPLKMMQLSILEVQKDYVAMERLYRDLQVQHSNVSWIPISLAKLLNSQDRYADAKKVLEEYVSSHSDDQKTKLLLVSLVKTKEPEQAINLLDGFIKQEPKDFELRFGKAELLVAVGRIGMATDVIKEIATLDSEGNAGRKAIIMLAGVAFKKGELEVANTQISEVLSIAPEDEAALLLKARINIADKQFDTAVTDLRIVLRNNPASDEALVLLAQAYMSSGSEELADDNFRQALSVNPSNTIAALSVANSMMKTKDLKRTEEVLLTALDNAKNKAPLLQALAQVRLLKKDWLGTESIIDSLKVDKQETAFTYYLRARISQGQANYEAAVADYRAALEKNSNMVRALQGLASSYLKLDKKPLLLTYLNTYITNNPRKLIGYGMLSSVYVTGKQWAGALRVLEEGVAVEPKWQGGYSRMASVYLAQDKHEQAIASYKRGLEKSPNSNYLILQMASAYEGFSDFSNAKVLYEQVLENDPSVEPAINNLASLLTDQFNSKENIEKALVMVERFKTATEPYYLDTYAWTNILSGKLEKAQLVLERVVSLSPNVAVFNYHLGVLYSKQGNQPDAKHYLTAAKLLADKQGDMNISKMAEDLLATVGS